MTRRYRLTGKILRLAHGVARSLDLQRVARPHLKALRDRLRETVHLGVMEDLGVFYVDKLESPTTASSSCSRWARTMPLHSTSLGKAILAALPEDEREAKYRADGLRAAHGPDDLPRSTAFREEIALTQARGYATDDRENEPLGACVAAAIIGPDGRPVGAISVSGPHYPRPRATSRVRRAGPGTAAQIAWELGPTRSARTCRRPTPRTHGPPVR